LRAIPRSQSRRRCRSRCRSDCSGARDSACSSQSASVDLDRAGARGGTASICNQQRAFRNGGAPGVGIRFREGQFTGASFGERTARATAAAAILDQSGKSSAQVIRANR
jgi:hypothetical protein